MYYELEIHTNFLESIIKTIIYYLIIQGCTVETLHIILFRYLFIYLFLPLQQSHKVGTFIPTLKIRKQVAKDQGMRLAVLLTKRQADLRLENYELPPTCCEQSMREVCLIKCCMVTGGLLRPLLCRVSLE